GAAGEEVLVRRQVGRVAHRLAVGDLTAQLDDPFAAERPELREIVTTDVVLDLAAGTGDGEREIVPGAAGWHEHAIARVPRPSAQELVGPEIRAEDLAVDDVLGIAVVPHEVDRLRRAELARDEARALEEHAVAEARELGQRDAELRGRRQSLRVE